MSEYQYYEFQAVDRPLTEREMDELRALSSRADITPTRFVNVYNYGDFRGDPDRVLEKYFDAFVYVANWGTHRFMLRLPRRLLEVKSALPYCDDHCLTLKEKGKQVLLEFLLEEEGGDWEDGEGWLGSLLPLRDELLAGDLRCLYLGWLGAVQFEDVEEDALEPPVPAGLRQLSAPLKRLAEFLRIDPALIKAAAAMDTDTPVTPPTPEDLAGWIHKLPGAEKDKLLVQLVQEKSPHLKNELLQRFRQSQVKNAGGRKSKGASADRRRTVAALRVAWKDLEEKKERKATEKKAKEETRRTKEAAAARAAYLDTLPGREDDLWREADTLIATSQPKAYDRAVELLRDLRDLAAVTEQQDEVAKRLGQLRERYARKRTLIQRLDKAGL